MAWNLQQNAVFAAPAVRAVWWPRWGGAFVKWWYIHASPLGNMLQDTHTLSTRFSLLGRAQSCPEHPSWAELLEIYQPFISRILIHIGLRGSDLEDVRQQVLVNLWKGLPHYQKDAGGIKFRAWLSRLIRNSAVDWFRSQQAASRETSLEVVVQTSLPVEHPEMEASIEEEWQRYVLGLAVRNLKKTFSGKALEVLQLSMQGITSEEIGERLGIQTNSAYVLKGRIKTRLQREIKGIRAELEFPHHLS